MNIPARQVSLEMGQVHDLSLFLLEWLEDQRIDSDLAMAGVALTLVRLAHPLEPLPMDKEILYTQELIQLSQAQGATLQ